VGGVREIALGALRDNPSRDDTSRRRRQGAQDRTDEPRDDAARSEGSSITQVQVA